MQFNYLFLKRTWEDYFKNFFEKIVLIKNTFSGVKKPLKCYRNYMLLSLMENFLALLIPLIVRKENVYNMELNNLKNMLMREE